MRQHLTAKIMTTIEKPWTRVTKGALDGSFLRDRGRRLVVILDCGDLLTLKPHGTRRPETVSLFDVYRFALRARVNRETLERARDLVRTLPHAGLLLDRPLGADSAGGPAGPHPNRDRGRILEVVGRDSTQTPPATITGCGLFSCPRPPSPERRRINRNRSNPMRYT